MVATINISAIVHSPHTHEHTLTHSAHPTNRHNEKYLLHSCAPVQWNKRWQSFANGINGIMTKRISFEMVAHEWFCRNNTKVYRRKNEKNSQYCWNTTDVKLRRIREKALFPLLLLHSSFTLPNGTKKGTDKMIWDIIEPYAARVCLRVSAWYESGEICVQSVVRTIS